MRTSKSRPGKASRKNVMNPLRRMVAETRRGRNPLRDPENKQEKRRHRLIGPKPAWLDHPIPLPKPGPKLLEAPGKVRRLAQGDYIAEINVNRQISPPLFHYIVLKKDSPTIIEWGQSISLHAADAKARAALRSLCSSQRVPALVAAD